MKKLKILLGNNTLSLLAGSETWTYTLALALKELGHDVHCYSADLGIISNKLEEKGIKCFDKFTGSQVNPFSIVLEEKFDHNYDVIIANHNHVVAHLRECFPKTPIISTIHGILHRTDDGKIAPEYPALDSGVAQFVAVSEEVQEMLKKEYGIDSVIIRNFFDIKEFKKLQPANDKPKSFLINTNYMDQSNPEIQLIRDVAKHFGATVGAVGAGFVPSDNIIKSIEMVDVVFGMGRSVLEGVAGGRLGIVHGRWGTGGAINESNIDELRSFNFSGRNSQGTVATKEELIEMIEKNYTPENLAWGQKYMAENHNAIFAAEKYVALARELTGELMMKPQLEVDNRRKFRLAKDVSNK